MAKGFFHTKAVVLLGIVAFASVAVAQTGTITTVAGGGSTQGDGIPATDASLAYPTGVAADRDGNVFIADYGIVGDYGGRRIRRVDAVTKIITTVAGNGIFGFSGDGGPATSASLHGPFGVAVDSAGNLFIATLNDNRIRRVDAGTDGRVTGASDETITTVAGNGTFGFSGDGGPATSASLNFVYGVALDGAGNLFIAEQMNRRIRRVDAATGIITTVAGNGTFGSSGDGGPATSASLGGPIGVAVDSAGNLYIAENRHPRVRRVDAGTDGIVTGASDEIITTVAGNGTFGFSGDGGPATSAILNNPIGVAVDGARNVFIADSDNNRIRRVDASTGVITTVADGLGFPNGVAMDGAGNLLIADTDNQRVRRVEGVGAGGDLTPPVITPTVIGTLGNNGWYTSNVSVTWTVEDNESAISSTSGCDASTVTSDTSGVTFTCTATSAGGTASESVTIQRDATAPEITFTTPPEGASYLLAQAVAADYACSDVTSGVASCEGPVADGANINTATVGSKSFAVSAEDLAGNPTSLTHSYTVNYDFVGFLPPVHNPPVINAAKAGSTIPVKWRLLDSAGTPVTTLASYTSLGSVPIACHSSRTGAIEGMASATGGTILRYDATSNPFIHNWKTTKGWTGCRLLILTLSDGTLHFAKFEFK